MDPNKIQPNRVLTTQRMRTHYLRINYGEGGVKWYRIKKAIWSNPSWCQICGKTGPDYCKECEDSLNSYQG